MFRCTNISTSCAVNDYSGCGCEYLYFSYETARNRWATTSNKQTACVVLLYGGAYVCVSVNVNDIYLFLVVYYTCDCRHWRCVYCKRYTLV